MNTRTPDLQCMMCWLGVVFGTAAFADTPDRLAKKPADVPENTSMDAEACPSYEPLGSSTGGGGFNEFVRALVVMDDGSGPALFSAGSFTTTADGSRDLDRVARWNGQHWEALGSGLTASVQTLGGYSGELYAGGYFSHAGGIPASGLARWDGQIWSTVDGGVAGYSASVHTLLSFDDGGGPALYVAGDFADAGAAVGAENVARYDGSTLSAVGGGVIQSGDGTAAAVHALAVFDDGGGEDLYAGGLFDDAGGAAVSNIARWNGSAWSAVGNGVDGRILAMTVHDDGSGPALYVGGDFSSAGGVATSNIARWDGTAWEAVGSGVGTTGPVPAVFVLSSGPGPQSTRLYAGGGFASIDGQAAATLAAWDGATWSAVGSGLDVGTPTIIRSLCAFDDGSGPTLIVGGDFKQAGSRAVRHVARMRLCEPGFGGVFDNPDINP